MHACGCSEKKNTTYRIPESVMNKKSAIYNIFENRRRYPRLIIEMPVALCRSDSLQVTACIYDLSPDGAQIRYDGKSANLLFEPSLSLNKLREYTYTLKFDLLYAEKKVQIDIGVIPVYQHKIDTGLYSMGLSFDKNETDMIAVVNNYLNYELMPTSDEISQHIPPEELQELNKRRLDSSRLNPEHAAKQDPDSMRAPYIDRELLWEAINKITRDMKSLQESVDEIKRKLTRG